MRIHTFHNELRKCVQKIVVVKKSRHEKYLFLICFRFDRLPEGFSTMNARSVRNELSKIRDVANEISSDMAKVLDKSMKPKERRDEAR